MPRTTDCLPVKITGTRSWLGRQLNRCKWLYLRVATSRSQAMFGVLGAPMWLDLRNPGISPTLASRGIREPDHTALLAEFLRPGMTCLDLGANIGYYTVLMARCVGPTGQVIAVEPDPRNLAVLASNEGIAANYSRIRVIQAAVGAEDGHLMMEFGSATNLSRVADSLSGIESSSVTQADLCSLMREFKIDLIRMDIEGFELTILERLADCIGGGADAPSVIFEVHPSEYQGTDGGLTKPLRRLQEFGYKFDWLVTAGDGPGNETETLLGRPDRVFNDGPFRRLLFLSPDFGTACECVDAMPKRIRYAMISSRGRA